MANSKPEVSVIDASKDVIVELLDTATCAVKAIHNVAKAAEQGTALLVDVATVSRAYVLSQAKPETIQMLQSDASSDELLAMFGVTK